MENMAMPAVRREAAAHLRASLGVGERRACSPKPRKALRLGWMTSRAGRSGGRGHVDPGQAGGA